MTRKDYVALAQCIEQARLGIISKEPEVSRYDMLDGAALAAEHIADYLGKDNPRFDRVRFLRAAGVQ